MSFGPRVTDTSDPRPEGESSGSVGRPWWAQRAVWGTIGLGLLGSALWDWLASPGLSGVARGVLSVVTLGSAKLRDGAYASAALDSYPAPSTFLLTLVTLVACAGLGATVGLMIVDAPRKPNRSFGSREEIDAEMRQIRREMRKDRWQIGIIAAVLVSALLVASLFVTAAVDIRRAFLTNLAICAPYLSDADEEMLRAQFASVQTKGEYRLVDERLQAVAKGNNVRLVDLSLW